jgi:glycosyl transferase family 25
VESGTAPSGNAERTRLPPIWVISLERAHDRRQSVHRSFGAAGIPFELFDAVDGRALDPAERRQYSRWRSLFEVGRDLTLGDVGCSLSHIRVYERMVAEAIPEVVVVEDDVQPSPALADVLAARSALPADWQVVTLHSLFPTADPQALPGAPLVDGFRVCRYRRIPFGTQCYLVSLAGARRALEVAYPVRMPPDELLYRRRPAGLRVYGIEPSPVVHADFGSELRTARASDARGLQRLAERAVVAAGKARARIVRPSAMDR